MENPIFNCMDCNAACCRAGNRYQLFPPEAANMGLTPEHEVSYLVSLIDDRPSTYESTEDCMHLVESTEEELNDPLPAAPQYKCNIYDSPIRPRCCSHMQPGSEYCIHARRKFGYTDSKAEELENIT